MGTKKIWDGEQLPPIGCEVLIHLARADVWVAHVVDGYNIAPTDNAAYHRIFIVVKPSSDPRSSNNQRLLCDVRPMDWRFPAGESNV